MTADVTDVESSLKTAGSAAGSFADDVTAAARQADAASDKIGAVGDAADNLDDKAGKATGALGALGAGAELVGMEGLANGMSQAAMATDFMSGVGQSLNLVLELQVVQSARAKAASIAQAVAAKTVSAANKAWAVTQWLVNAALTANPVGLVIVAIVALVAAVVIAYKKSETFRDIAQAAFKVVTLQIRVTIEVVKLIISWVKEKVPPAFIAAKDKAVAAFSKVREFTRTVVSGIIGFFTGMRDKSAAAWSSIRDKVVSAAASIGDKAAGLRDRVTGFFATIRDKGSDMFTTAREKAVDLVTFVPGKIGDMATAIGNKVGQAKDALTGVFQAPLDVVKDLIGWVDDLLDKLGSLKDKLPSIDIPGLRVMGRTSDAGGWFGPAAPGPGGPADPVVININGAIDPEGTARQIKRILGAADIRRGVFG